MTYTSLSFRRYVIRSGTLDDCDVVVMVWMCGGGLKKLGRPIVDTIGTRMQHYISCHGHLLWRFTGAKNRLHGCPNIMFGLSRFYRPRTSRKTRDNAGSIARCFFIAVDSTYSIRRPASSAIGSNSPLDYLPADVADYFQHPTSSWLGHHGYIVRLGAVSTGEYIVDVRYLLP